MQSPKSHHSKIQDDILFHLELILIDLERLKLDFNRNPAIVSSCKNMMEKIVLVGQLHDRYDKPVFRAVKNKINKLVVENHSLKGIIIHVQNSRCKEQTGTISQFKITV